MKIMVYIGHPAQYHFFKNILKNLEDKGHQIKLLIKTKDILEDLVKQDDWNYINIQIKSRKNSKVSILIAALKRTLSVYKIARQFHADLLLGTDSSIAQAAWLLRKPSFTTLEDDVEIIHNLAKLTYPFTSYIVVPKVCQVGKWQNKKIGYDGYMKMAYLHPRYFIPSNDILRNYGIAEDYILIRLAKLTAHHDVGIKGLNINVVNKIIDIASNYGLRVYISSEIDLDSSLSQYQLAINPKDIHHVMAFSRILISDSQSMSVEAAMLGIPSLRFSDFVGRISVLEELEHQYNLTYGIATSTPDRLIAKLNEILETPQMLFQYKSRHCKMMNDKIDVTAFLVWLIDSYPNSICSIRQGEEFQKPFQNRI